MKLFSKTTCILFAAALLAASCSSSGTGSDGGGDGNDGNQPVTYSLGTDVSPANSGTVSPSSGTFDEGASVTVDATAASGYEFVQWTGDIQSSDNPLSFTINANTNLTANFQQRQESEYTMSLGVSDSLYTQDLAFGQGSTGTAGFDQGLDKEAPPAPPEGTLNSFFKSSAGSLLYDIRNSTKASITWNLQIQPGQGDSLFFEWTLDETFLNGALTLRNNDSSISVDMLSATSLEIDTASVDSLLIEYEVGQ